MDIAMSVVLRARFSLLLGYYADMLFSKHNEAFIKTMDFLFHSVGYENKTPETVIALQSIDTLNTVVSDSDLAPRLEPMLPRIVEILCQLTGVICYPAYFEFLSEFVKFYAVVLKDYVHSILGSVINRILAEQHKIQSNTEEKTPGTVVIGKCWNVIKMICERHEYMPEMHSMIEDMLKQLYVFMTDPKKISFEDDITMNMK